MNFKRLFLPSFLAAAVLAFAALPALAGHDGTGKSCPLSGQKQAGCDHAMGKSCGKGGCQKSAGCSREKSMCPIAAKVCKTACWLLKHESDLGLTQEQVAKIKSIDLEVEKGNVRSMAEMKTFMLDANNLLEQTPLDVASLEALIDKGMAGMAAAAKVNIKAYSELQSILTEDQKAKRIELKTAGREGHQSHQS